MSELHELIVERERLHAYGLSHALALIDAEIERLSRPVEATPVDRHAPEHVTTAPDAPKRAPGRPRKATT